MFEPLPWPEYPKGPGCYVYKRHRDGKMYVGKGQCVRGRIQTHNRGSTSKLLTRAIAKDGVPGFSLAVIQTDTEAEAVELEVLLIAELNTQAPNGFNLTAGGEGAPGRVMQPETLAKIQNKSKETRRMKKGGKGEQASLLRRGSLDTRNRARFGSQEWRDAISRGAKGKKRSEEARRNMSAARRKTAKATAEKLRQRWQALPEDAKEAHREKARQAGRAVWEGMTPEEQERCREAGRHHRARA